MHTKGPWIQKKDKPFIKTTSGIHVALIIDYELDNIEEAEANARLIAAAPELLEALSGVIQFMNLMGIKVPEDADRILAKAKGLAT